MQRLPPALLALLIQLGSLGICLCLSLIFPQLSLGLFLLLNSMLAALLSAYCQQRIWWILIQLLFLPAAIILLYWQLPAWLYLGLFMLLMLIYWSSYRTQVPLYLSSPSVRHALTQFLSKRHHTPYRLLDLGCGTGSMICHLAHQHPDSHLTGIESAPLPWLISRIRCFLFYDRRQCQIIHADFWQHDLGPYDVVYAYLSPVPMTQLWQKACQEMQPGSLLISCEFAIPEQPADHIITTQGRRPVTLYIWELGSVDTRQHTLA